MKNNYLISELNRCDQIVATRVSFWIKIREEMVRRRYWAEMIAPYELLAIGICRQLENAQDR